MLLRAENWLVSGRGDTELLDAEQRTQNSGRRTADAEQRDTEQRTQNSGRRTADAEQRTQNSGRRTADAEQRDGRAYSSLHRLRF